MADDRPDALTAGLVGRRLVLAVLALVVAAACVVLAWSVLASDTPSDGRVATGLSLGLGLFLVVWAIGQLRALATVARGDRWWAFVELLVEEDPGRRRSRRERAEGPRCYLELTRSADEQLVGRAALPCPWATRLAEDGVVAVYGGGDVGDRIAIGGTTGVCWQPGRIEPTATRPSAGGRGSPSTRP